MTSAELPRIVLGVMPTSLAETHSAKFLAAAALPTRVRTSNSP